MEYDFNKMVLLKTVRESIGNEWNWTLFSIVKTTRNKAAKCKIHRRRMNISHAIAHMDGMLKDKMILVNLARTNITSLDMAS